MCCISNCRVVLPVSTSVCSILRETCNVISVTPCSRTVAILVWSYVQYVIPLVGKLYENLKYPWSLITKGKYTDTAYVLLLCRLVENSGVSRCSEARGHRSLWPLLTEITIFKNNRNLLSILCLNNLKLLESRKYFFCKTFRLSHLCPFCPLRTHPPHPRTWITVISP